MEAAHLALYLHALSAAILALCGIIAGYYNTRAIADLRQMIATQCSGDKTTQEE